MRVLSSHLISMLLFLSLSLFHVSAFAIPVNYSFTLDTVLNNQNGSWGGDLNIGAGQHLNLSVVFQYDSSGLVSRPFSYDIATFNLRSLQVFDNTNGLSSDVLFGGGDISILYDNLNDSFNGAGFGFFFPGYRGGGGPFLPGVSGEFGNAGDDLPYGASFDALVNAAGIGRLIARAPDYEYDNVFDTDGIVDIAAGDYVFFSEAISQPIPEPTTMLMMGMGLAGLGFARKKQKSS